MNAWYDNRKTEIATFVERRFNGSAKVSTRPECAVSPSGLTCVETSCQFSAWNIPLQGISDKMDVTVHSYVMICQYNGLWRYIKVIFATASLICKCTLN